jgi:hypothetical protein
VSGTEGAERPFFSPDGRAIAYFAAGRLHRWNLGGGAPQPLADAPSPQGGAWGEDGTIVYAPLWNGGLYEVKATGGAPESLIQADGSRDYAFVFPRFVPGRREVLFTSWGRGLGVWRLDLSERERSSVVPGGSSGSVTTSGHLLYAQANLEWSGLLAVSVGIRWHRAICQ